MRSGCRHGYAHGGAHALAQAAGHDAGTGRQLVAICHAPQFHEDGSLKRPATLTVLQNNVLVQDHLELLQSLGAKPVVTEFYVPEKLFSDKALFAAVTELVGSL